MGTRKILTEASARISQGAVFEDVELLESVRRDGDKLVVSRIVFPQVVVLTQDCDLEQEHKTRWTHENATQSGNHPHDKFLISALVAPMYNAAHLFSGEHLSELKMKMQKIESARRRVIQQNSNPRYHYLNFETESQLVPSVIDFKHYFSVPTLMLQSTNARVIGMISELFREDLSQRFSSYLSRIGLPD